MAKKPQQRAIAGPEAQDFERTESRQLTTVGDDEAVLVHTEKSLAVRLNESEIENQVRTARKYPREIERACKAMRTMATMDPESAAEMTYALPRRSSEGDKEIVGPSIRFAEIAMQAWGNCRGTARVVEINTTLKYVEARGVFHDLETNVEIEAYVRSRISGKYGLYTEDMINTTGNAAASKAKRNVILAGIPRAAWRGAWEASRKASRGTKEDLPVARQQMIGAFAKLGVTADRLLTAVGVTSEVGITLDHMEKLRGMYAGLKTGESTMEDLFPVRVAMDAQPAAEKSQTLDDVASGKAKTKKEREAELNAAHSEGAMAFHKGVNINGAKAKYKDDEDMQAAWRLGWHDTEKESGESEDGKPDSQEEVDF